MYQSRKQGMTLLSKRMIVGSSLLISLLSATSAFASDNNPCHIIYDAGSSGTRMYVYEQRSDQWKVHKGPKMEALADPIRQHRGKTAQDIPLVVTQLADTLQQIKAEGPHNEKGKPAWRAFNWQTSCELQSVMVYATAGMRIAEQNNPQQSQQMWQALNQALRQQLPDSVDVVTKTLSGYEEGLYAWLAVHDEVQNTQFGIVEMGGASSQVTFPCPDCEPNDALRRVKVGNQELPMYSYSFLGLGQDEAAKVLGVAESCQHGIGSRQKNWQLSACQETLKLTQSGGILDPYNYQYQQQAQYRKIPTEQGRQVEWYLTGAFKHRQTNDEQQCCINRGACHKAETSCFRVAYLPKYLQALGVPNDAPVKKDADWPLGAAICRSNDCLANAEPPVCRWNKTGCL
ncbi:hypothetical protein [Vibrio metschnikovii]|uniref:hypothetical protein n=1 Tax=Vibrio metschnikovii TaxID=28172 RepID=UPI001C30195F|nr:hypothetical protein [Vibrio metschnikovii]